MDSEIGVVDNVGKKRRSNLTRDENDFKIKRESSADKDIASFLSSKEATCGDDENEPEVGDDDGHAIHGFHLVEGKMNHGMEDYIVARNQKMNGFDLGLYAIFDGHSGRFVAEYLQKHLFDKILSDPEFWTDPKSTMKRVYKQMNEEILANVVGSYGGSTAVTAILVNGKRLIVGNVGDSRAIICRKGVAEAITVDHDPEREKGMVERRGGFVLKTADNISRVDGQLAMARAFGDERVKDHISVEPDVVFVKVDNDTEFMILASDGLWKVMSNEEAADCIKDIGDPGEAAKELISSALSRRSCDDISCVVVRFIH
ncbi:probable protein phosphatase 2C 58 [Impatiens glandulifera]|uniref:probable protein phosphatase 2C 58 n=1 Tax=Impatiens glandulifera TaxID=253017 RepID=UPI001FB07890|nr:probable protein phosphatase 2C 58 [Impatiens glandulifera]